MRRRKRKGKRKEEGKERNLDGGKWCEGNGERGRKTHLLHARDGKII